MLSIISSQVIRLGIVHVSYSILYREYAGHLYKNIITIIITFSIIIIIKNTIILMMTYWYVMQLKILICENTGNRHVRVGITIEILFNHTHTSSYHQHNGVLCYVLLCCVSIKVYCKYKSSS